MPPRILFLTTENPMVSLSGGASVTRTLLDILRTSYVVRVLCMHEDVESDVPTAGESPGFTAVRHPIHIRRKPLALGRSLYRSVTWREPYGISKFWSPEYARQVLESSGHVDMLVCDHLATVQYGRLAEHLPQVCIWHNLESELIASARSFAPAWLRPLLAVEESRLRAVERKLASDRSRHVFLSNHDSLKSGVDSAKAMVAPLEALWPSSPTKPPADDGRLRLGFLGTGSWPPNRDAIRWLLDSIDRAKLHLLPNWELVIGGHGTELVHVQSALRAVVRLVGYVEDLSAFHAQLHGFVAPIRFGGGAKIKSIDAVARGVPVLATSEGATGLPDPHESVVRADGAELIVQLRSWIENPQMLIARRNETAARAEKRWGERGKAIGAFVREWAQLIALERSAA